MNVLMLGTAERRLFALHDPAVRTGGRVRAAVLCNPLGDEYTYSHRSLRHLALRLAKRGFHVLRFDYYGTGDSGGRDEEADPLRMHEDAGMAIEAAIDAAGCARVVLIGLRHGCTVAAESAAHRSNSIESLVLWDPLYAPQALPPATPTLILSTQQTPPAPPAVHVPAPCCWEESITVSGALPVPAFQCIEEWLG